jgi:hypothetical protein
MNLKSHYEKIILVTSLLIALVLGLVSLFSNSDLDVPRNGMQGDLFWFDINDAGSQILELSKETNLLPGDSITFVSNSDDSIADSFEISKIILIKGSTCTIRFGNREMEGTIMAGSDLTLGRDWQKSKIVLDFITDDGRVPIPLSQILSIRGERQFIFDQPIEEFDPDERYISLYQGLGADETEGNQTKIDRARWTKPALESVDSIYDLFTPPIIYLIDGNLTTKLPEKVVETVVRTEDFGLVLEGFRKKPYRFRMSGWIGGVPIFDDQAPDVIQRRQNKRIRMEKGIPYRENVTGKPGTSSLVPTTPEDASKLLIVKYFEVQQIRDEKTGGVRSVGRAMVQDYKLGGDPFEINSLMPEVFAGENEIRMSFRLDGANELIVFSDKDIGKTLEFGSRKYLVKEINSDDKSLLIEKRGPEANDFREETLALP